MEAIGPLNQLLMLKNQRILTFTSWKLQVLTGKLHFCLRFTSAFIVGKDEVVYDKVLSPRFY